jgi:hypothetical protein
VVKDRLHSTAKTALKAGLLALLHYLQIIEGGLAVIDVCIVVPDSELTKYLVNRSPMGINIDKQCGYDLIMDLRTMMKATKQAKLH